MVLGMLYVSIGAGSLVGTFLMASLGDFKSRGLANMASILIVTILLILFGLSSNMVLSAALIGLLGTFNMIYCISNNALVQSRIPDELRGRITSIYAIDHGVQPIEIPLLGLLAVGLGTGNAVAVAGLFTLGVTAIIGLRWRQLWRLQ